MQLADACLDTVEVRRTDAGQSAHATSLQKLFCNNLLLYALDYPLFLR